jgi:hypothetical protein
MRDKHSGPPEVETRDVIRWIVDPTTLHHHAESPDPLEKPVRPMLRPAVPILRALDDGTLADGEDFRLRRDTITIGRSEGDIVIPADRTLSGKHAEIRRVENRGQVCWMLVDLDTANGTFVRVTAANLFPETTVIIGARRFRLVEPFGEQRMIDQPSTTVLDRMATPPDVWPILVETGTSTAALRFPIRQDEMTIGRLDGGCSIAIDDPHLAKHHATITRTASGVWQIRPGNTSNGVWVNIRTVTLTNHCYFRCGEQHFRFTIP